MHAHSNIKTLKIGMIPYWNLLPFRQELQRDRGLSIELKMGFPTSINKWLQEGSVHLAPSSSICLAQPGFEMALPLGIATNGAVKSVYLGLHNEHLPLLDLLNSKLEILTRVFSEAFSSSEASFDSRKISQQVWDAVKGLSSLAISDCPSLKVPTASASSIALTKIVYNFWFGCDAYKFMCARNFSGLYSEQKPIELLIGDEALQKQNNFAKTIDLGLLWKDLTGLPFVFAVWQSKGLCLNGWRRKILEVGELAQKKMSVEPQSYIPALAPKDESGIDIPLAEYWRSIRYRLGPEEFKGLLIFLCLARKLSDQPLDHEIAVKLLRWQEVTQSTSSFSI